MSKKKNNRKTENVTYVCLDSKQVKKRHAISVLHLIFAILSFIVAIASFSVMYNKLDTQTAFAETQITGKDSNEHFSMEATPEICTYRGDLAIKGTLSYTTTDPTNVDFNDGICHFFCFLSNFLLFNSIIW